MSNVKLFESTQIRSVWNEVDGKWYFSVADVVKALTDSVNVRDYIKKMRKREPELDANWGTLCPPLELLARDRIGSPITAKIRVVTKDVYTPSDSPKDASWRQGAL